VPGGEAGSGGGEAFPALRTAAAFAYVDDLDEPELEEADVHHLVSALRLRTGESVVVADGSGRFRLCTARVDSGRAAEVTRPAAGQVRPDAPAPARSARGRSSPVLRLEPAGDVVTLTRAGQPVAVGFSLAKGDRTEWAVAKLSELGVDTIVPLLCDRTVVHWEGEKAVRNAERLCRVAREASMQARRVFLPEVRHPMAVEEAVRQLGTVGVALAEPGGAALTPAARALLVGPEGGFSERELGLGLPQVGFGPTVLRVETAAVAAGVVLTALRSGMVLPQER
jgi:16S rRNA (uracil1498-N3)-methyltransferase